VKKYPILIKPFGIHAVIIEWPNKVDEAILDDILQFRQFLIAELAEGWEFIPAYNSLALINTCVCIEEKSFYAKLKDWYAQLEQQKKAQRFEWTLPVSYNTEFGPDIEEVCETLGCSVDELIMKHTSVAYTIFGIGFLPGFMYLGGLPKDLEIPRKKI